jgi:hypothetical protein
MLASWIEDLAEMGLKWAAFEAATLLGWTKIAAAIGNPFSSSASGIGGLLGGIFGGGGAAGGAASAAVPAYSMFGGGGSDDQIIQCMSQLNTTITAAQAATTLNTSTLGLATTATDTNTAEGLTTNTSGVAANTLGVGVNTTALAANTTALSAGSGTSAASGAGSFLDGIPLIGSVFKFLGFDQGAYEIPGTTLGILHAGEMVLPAAAAAQARSTGSIRPFAAGIGSIPPPIAYANVAGSFATAAPSAAAGSAGGAGLNVNFSPQVRSLNAKDTIAHLSDPKIMRWMAKTLQSYMAANPSTRGAY